MPRYKVTQPPAGVIVTKTSRGTWIGLMERWEGDRLLELIPITLDGGPEILQEHERRDMLKQVGLALKNAEILKLRQQLERLSPPKPSGGSSDGASRARDILSHQDVSTDGEDDVFGEEYVLPPTRRVS